MELSEELLHYLWRYRLYSTKDLKTGNNKSLVVRSPGWLNKDAGPDFEHGRLMIDGTEWAGNIEIHVKSSDWRRHRHDQDKAYNNVILHVVYEYDEEIKLADGTSPETLELKPRINVSLLDRYKGMMSGKSWVPCQGQLASIDDFKVSTWLERVLVERLEERDAMVRDFLAQSAHDWVEVTYLLLARSFGFGVNALPFEALARSMPYKLFLKCRLNVLLIEALVFGQAGMLENKVFIDPYPNELRRQYAYLKNQYQLTPIDYSLWKFLRMRPANFPTMRLAQFAAWCSKGEHLFSRILSSKSVDECRNIFSTLPVHDYWCFHYRFDKSTYEHSNALGISAIDVLILNTAVTILFSYGKYIGKETYIYRAINLLRELPYEKNGVIEKFRTLGVAVKDAADSQALLQLKKRYCDRYKCLDCGIGLQVFKQNVRL